MKSKTIYFLVAAMGVIVVTSNILVQFLLGSWLTWAAFTYPLAFVVTDISNRLFGVKQARKIVLFGFIIGVLCSLVASQLVNADGYALTTFRIALASGLAFLVAQLFDVAVFDRLRIKKWWQAPLASSIIGSVIDTIIFFSVAFSAAFVFLEPQNDVTWANELVPLLGIGKLLPLWTSLAFADFLAKLLVAGIGLILFRFFTKKLTKSIN